MTTEKKLCIHTDVLASWLFQQAPHQELSLRCSLCLEPSPRFPAPISAWPPPHFIQPSAQMVLPKEPAVDEIALTLPVSTQLPGFILIMTFII